MASVRKLEVPLHLSVPRSVSTPTVKAQNGLDTEGGSTVSNDIFFRHEHPRRALEGNSVIAIVLAALVVAYLLVTCMRHLSKNLRLSSHQVRLLASNFPDDSEDEDKCPAPSGNDGEEATTSNMEGDTGLAEAAGGAAAAAAAQPEEMGAAAPPDPSAQSRRRLPPFTQSIVRKTLLLLQQPAAAVSPLLQVMRPDQCLSMVKTLCVIVAAELSAFSTVPPGLQPLRQQAAAAYATLIDEVLSIGATADEAQRMGWGDDLLVMQRLLHRLAETPPESERLPMHFYSIIMECQQHVSHWMLSQILHFLHTVADVVTPGNTTDSDEVISQQLQVLSAIRRVRLRQILNSTTTRHWIQKQQNRLKTTVVYTPDDILDAVSHNPGNTDQRRKAITNAVIAAGAQPTSDWAPLPLSQEEQQLQLQVHPDLTQQLQQQHQGAPHSDTAKTDGLLPRPPLPPPAEQPPVVPQTPYAMPHDHQPHVAEDYTLLPFDPVEQDAGFPAIHPDPQLSGHDGVLEKAPALLQIQLPFSYNISYLSLPSSLEPSTSSSAPTVPGGLSGDFSAHGHHSGSTDQQQPTQPTPQQTPTSKPELSSSEDEDAR
ncbi:hypothetical protein Emed_003990 [Eimeria media]